MRLPLSLGSAGDAVRRLQRVLGMPVTGLFDQATGLAVMAWQSLRGMPGSGTVDAATWDRLAVHLMAEAKEQRA